jgi:hypothetical protein
MASKIMTYSIAEGPLPDGAPTGTPSGGTSLKLADLNGLTIGKQYRMNMVINIGVVNSNVTGWLDNGYYSISFNNDTARPLIANSINKAVIGYTNFINGKATLQPIANKRVVTLSYNAVFQAQQKDHQVWLNFFNFTDPNNANTLVPLSPPASYVFAPPAGALSFIQLQPL